MGVSNDLLLAVLAMDSYNRGYNAGINISGDRIANASLGISTDPDLDPEAMAASFFAQAYTLANGKTVISYRGTDVLPGATDPFFSALLPASEAATERSPDGAQRHPGASAPAFRSRSMRATRWSDVVGRAVSEGASP